MKKQLYFFKQFGEKFKFFFRSIISILKKNKHTYRFLHFFKKIYIKFFAKCSFFTKKIKNKFKLIFDRKITPNGVSIIIPTYKETPYLAECINSIENQTYSCKKIEVILSVNGDDIDYYNKLKDIYSERPNFKVIHTYKKGLSVARNFALDYVTKDFFTYLDDDDYITPGFIFSLVKILRKSVTIACGKLFDYDETTKEFNKNTYVNSAIASNSGLITDDYFHAGSLLSSANMKLYKTSMIKKFIPFDETLLHTEDIVYFCENFDNISGNLAICNANSNEAYIRRLTSNSMSRPSLEQQFDFSITDRINIIERISKGMFNPRLTIENKNFLMIKINSQTNFMLDYYNTLTADMRDKALSKIKHSDCFFLNKSKFANIQGIAFCHNFPPSNDASAYVASKRLSQISELENNPIKWDVVTADMSNCRQMDNLYSMYYVNYVINSKTVIPGKAYYNEKSQYIFGQKAFSLVKDKKADIIYSRSFFAGSHVAAYFYKKQYPDVKWYAEFSDPVYMATDNKKRKPSVNFEGEDAMFNTFWKDLEDMVYELADVVIYTNANQRKYMLNYLGNPTLAEKIMTRSLVMNHPIMDTKFCNLLNYDFKFDKKKINIGYFGTFYANRKYDDMLKLIENPDVVLNIFTPQVNELYEQLGDFDREKIRLFKTVSNLYFLNIASKLDYIYLNDINFDGEINPYLPSKYADYCTSGTKIIAKINDGSPLSAMDNKNLIKIKEINSKFINSLKKQK